MHASERQISMVQSKLIVPPLWLPHNNGLYLACDRRDRVLLRSSTLALVREVAMDYFIFAGSIPSTGLAVLRLLLPAVKS
jgi:hypothetical protein